MQENLPTHKGPFAYRAEVLAVAWATTKREILTPGYVKRTVATAVVITFGNAAFWGMGEFLNYLWGAVAACGLFGIVLLLALVWELFVTPSKLRNGMVDQVHAMNSTIKGFYDEERIGRAREALMGLLRDGRAILGKGVPYVSVNSQKIADWVSDVVAAIRRHHSVIWFSETDFDSLNPSWRSRESQKQFDDATDRIVLRGGAGYCLYACFELAVNWLGDALNGEPSVSYPRAAPQDPPDPTRDP